jgi:energy-coupling factor transport system ATP-binding protein
MIEVKELTHIYNRGTPWEIKALGGISFHVEGGECVGIVGESGCGKSTLAQNVAGILPPAFGSVLIDGFDIYTARRGRDIRKEVGLIFQSPADQLFEESVFKEISFGLRGRRDLSRSEIEERVKGVCKRLYPPLGELLDRSPFELGEGERAMVAIASVLITEPEILILDEPLAGLDPENRVQVSQQIEILRQHKKTLIILSSQSEGLVPLLDRLIFLHGGKIIAQGKLQDIVASKEIDPRVRDLLPPLTRMLIHLREKGIEVNPALDTPAAVSKEIHRLLQNKRKDS